MMLFSIVLFFGRDFELFAKNEVWLFRKKKNEQTHNTSTFQHIERKSLTDIGYFFWRWDPLKERSSERVDYDQFLPRNGLFGSLQRFFKH